MDVSRLGQVTLLSHLVNDFQILTGLLERGQGSAIDFQLHVSPKVVLLVLQVHLRRNDPVIIDSFVVDSIEIAQHFYEALIAFFYDW